MNFFVRKWICRQAVSSTRNSSTPRLYEIKKSSGRLGSMQFVVKQIQPMHRCNLVLPGRVFTKIGYIDVLFTSKSWQPWLFFMITKLHVVSINTCMRECFNAFLEGLLSQSQTVLFPMMSSKMLNTSPNSLIHWSGPDRGGTWDAETAGIAEKKRWRETGHTWPNHLQYVVQLCTTEPWEMNASHVYARKHRIAHCDAALHSQWDEKNVAHTI